MIEDFHQFQSLTQHWPDVLRQAFYTAYQCVRETNLLHFGLLGLGEPREIFELLATLDWIDFCGGRKSVAAAESAIMSGRNNQPFLWQVKSFTCGHRASLEIAHQVRLSVHSAIKQPIPAFVSSLGLDTLEKWQVKYIANAQHGGLLDDGLEPTRKWGAFCKGFREQLKLTWLDWGETSFESLTAVLMHEANAAAPFLPIQGGGDDDDVKPVWDGAQLTYNGVIVKAYKKHPAQNQRKLLDAFHDAGWTTMIANPFNDSSVSSVTTLRTMNETIRALNANIKKNTIKFEAMGNGKCQWIKR